MASFKQITIVGHLGSDPTMRFTGDGTAVASFHVAVNGYAKKGEEVPTVWFKVSAWRRLAEIASEYLKKGTAVLVVGDPDMETWQAQDGTTRANITVVANQVTILTPKGVVEQAPEPRKPQQGSRPNPEPSFGPEDEEIPF